MDFKQANKRKNRRYYLHRCIKKQGIRYSAPLKTIYCEWDKPLANNYVTELEQSFGYSIQTELY